MRHEHVAKGSDNEINLFDAVISFKNLLHVWVFFFFFPFSNTLAELVAGCPAGGDERVLMYSGQCV